MRDKSKKPQKYKMKRFSYFLLAITAILTFAQCDDNTEGLGSSIIPGNDIISAETKTFHATSRTILANDSILANNSEVYLGQFTDPESGTVFNSSFITQFGCAEGFELPEDGVVGDSSTYLKLRLYFNEYYGDSLNAMRCEVYELDNTLQEGIPYYTNLSPEDFYEQGKTPLAAKTFNAIDFTQHDTILYGEYTRHIEIPLPSSIGNRFVKMYYEKDEEGKIIGKKHFANSEAFINDVFKGVYVKCTHGDGTVIKVYRARLDLGFQRYIKSSSGEKDSIQALTAPFYSGKEVLQANKFNNNNLTELLDENGHTYIKTPAGLFTEVTLPVIEAMESCDTINSAKLVFTRYNQTGDATSNAHQTLLMVKKSDMYKFFLKNSLADNKTSYLTTFDNGNNEYRFSNISNMLKHCYNEYTKGIESDSNWESSNPDWNKVVLIPVKTTKDSNGNVVKIVHDISISSMRLRGGTEYSIPIEIVTSKFND